MPQAPNSIENPLLFKLIDAIHLPAEAEELSGVFSVIKQRVCLYTRYA